MPTGKKPRWVSSITQGETAARGVSQRLAALSVGDSAYEAYLSRRATRQPGLPVIKFVRVDEQSKRYEKTIVAEMHPLVGKPLDLNAVGSRITELYGLGYFETLDYSLVEQGNGPDGETGLEVRARRKSWGPNYVRFGLTLEDDFQGNNQYNAAARFLMTELDDLGAELLTDVQIGSDPKVTTEFYQPLDALRKWFVAPSARVEGRDLPIYMNNLEIADFRDREVEGDIDFGRNLGNWGEIRVGYHRINGETYDRYGDPDLVTPDYNNGEYFFKFTYDRLDNVHFPREGQTFSLQWDANRTNLGSNFAFDKVTADWLFATSRGRNTLLLWTSAGTTLDGDFKPTDVQDFYSLGGFFNLSGLAPHSLLGPNFAIARAIYFRKIGHGGEGFFEFPAYVGMSLELGNTWEHRGDISYGSAHKDASLFVAFDTFLGPVYLGTGYDQSGNAGYYLFLGRTF
jgi:NTE family protein